jgi:hypothetical protein
MLLVVMLDRARSQGPGPVMPLAGWSIRKMPLQVPQEPIITEKKNDGGVTTPAHNDDDGRASRHLHLHDKGTRIAPGRTIGPCLR